MIENIFIFVTPLCTSYSIPLRVLYGELIDDFKKSSVILINARDPLEESHANFLKLSIRNV